MRGYTYSKDSVKRPSRVAFIGPADLSASMGYITSIPKIEKQVLLDAIVNVLEACEKHSVIPGIWGGNVKIVNEYILKEDFVSSH